MNNQTNQKRDNLANPGTSVEVDYDNEKHIDLVTDIFELRNGRTTIDHMRKMLLRSNLGPARDDIEAVLKIVESSLVSDIDGTYSVDDLVSQMHETMSRGTPMHTINESYATFDPKLTGKITVDGLRAAVAASGNEMGLEEATKLITMYASTPEGKRDLFITRDEFVEMVKEDVQRRITV